MTGERTSPDLAPNSPDRGDKHIDELGWGLFLLMTGSLWLLPQGAVPKGAWLMGTGVLLLGLSAARYMLRRRPSGFTIALGVVALAGGVSDSLGVKLPLFAICLVALGMSIVLKTLVRRTA